MRASSGIAVRPGGDADLRSLFTDDARLLRFARLAAAFLAPVTLVLAFAACGFGPDPRHNWLGDVVGSDLSQVWVAGERALAGRAAESYELAVHLANLAAAFGPECRFAWHYPPVFLIPAAGLAALSPQVAILAWMTLSLAIFTAATFVATGRRDAVLIALAHPLVFCNLTYGQNGLITAGLLTLGATLVDRRPWLAGLCFGLVAYKPQLAAFAPVVLLLTGRREVLAACLGTALALCLASVAFFGLDPWRSFLTTLSETDRLLLRDAAAGLDINFSAFGTMRLVGGGMSAAWAFQAGVTGATFAVAWRVWSRCADTHLRAATLLACVPMASLYLPIYDLAPLIPATILLAIAAHRAGGLRGYERGLMILAPLTAAFRPLVNEIGIPFGFLFAAATLLCVAARALPAMPPRTVSTVAHPA